MEPTEGIDNTPDKEPELGESIVGDPAEEQETPFELFPMENDFHVEQAMIRIRKMDENILRIKNRYIEFAEKEVEQIQKNRKHEEDQIKGYLIWQKVDKVKVMNGSAQFRNYKDVVKFDDDDKAFFEWINQEENQVQKEALVRVKEEIDKTEVKKYVKETGDIPDGVNVVSLERKFSITVK